jgi:hypothetical protein
MNRKLLLLTSILFAACNVDHSLGTTELDPDASASGADANPTSTPPLADAATVPVTDAAEPFSPDGPIPLKVDASTPPSSAGSLPCEVIAKDIGGARCVSAHSTVRVIVPGYSGPLYQLCKGTSLAGVPNPCTGETKDIMAKAGYADVETHEAFCADQDCTIAKIYDQSGKGNDLEPAPRGGAKSTPDNPAKASALPVTISGHRAYGVLIKPGMGYRTGCNGCTIKKGNGMALGDEPQSVYMVTSQKDLIDGCCFEYGNAETTSNDDGNGTAEAVNFSAGVVWGTGSGGKPGPWVLADLENGLFAGWENQQDKNISTNKPLKFDFVTAVLVGDTSDKNNGKGRFALYGADATGNDATFGKLTCMYDGIRPEKPGYVPMMKQGSLVLGTAGDNSSGGGGRFYEGATVVGPALSGTTLATLQGAIIIAGYGSETAVTKPIDTSPVTGPTQSWTGYVENFKFGSGSDRIKLSFAIDGAGEVLGTVTFGNGMAPPPATDPNVGYPPGMETTQTMPAEYLEGPAYGIKTGSLAANRLRFTIDMVDLWSDWCKLQTPPVDGSDLCVPNWGGESLPGHTVCYLYSPSGDKVPIDCVKWDLCFMSRICKCSPAGCAVNYEESGYKLSFDVFLANGTGSGSMTGTFGEHNVHFTKD